MINNIKTIIPISCPHCEKNMFVEFTNKSPEVTCIFTAENVASAKEDARIRVSCLTIDDDKKKSVLDWINDDATVFSESEVDSIVQSLITPN